jgi:hypothetical protein
MCCCCEIVLQRVWIIWRADVEFSFEKQRESRKCFTQDLTNMLAVEYYNDSWG